MHCPQCGWEIQTQDEWVKGKCSNCEKRDNTCTECGELVTQTSVYVVLGKGRGHRECLE